MIIWPRSDEPTAEERGAPSLDHSWRGRASKVAASQSVKTFSKTSYVSRHVGTPLDHAGAGVHCLARSHGPGRSVWRGHPCFLPARCGRMGQTDLV
jgi:hypothetical protein